MSTHSLARRAALLFGLLPVALSPAQAQVSFPPAPMASPSDLERALDQLGLSRQAIRIRSVDLDRLTNRQRPGSVLAHLLNDPFASKAFAQYVRATLAQNLRPPQPGKFESAFWSGIDTFDREVARPISESALANILSTLSRFKDDVVRRTLLGNPIEADMNAAARPDALLAAIEALHTRAGETLSAEKEDSLRTRVRALPDHVRRAAALVLRVADRAVAARDRAIRGLDRNRLADMKTLDEILEFGEPNGRNADADRDRLEAFQIRPMIAAAQELVMAAGVAATLLRGTESPSAKFTWTTPYGRIRISTRGKSTYKNNRHYLLIIDTAGNDTYHTGANAIGLEHPVSILIDTAGDDRYRLPHDPIKPAAASRPAGSEFAAVPKQTLHAAFGAGMLGIGILLDTAGDDEYEAVQRSMGYGLFGIGILADLAGDDHYDAIADSQGMASAGIGLLLDLAGNDTYDCYTQSQGFGHLDGLGCLIDVDGNDRYLANDKDIRFPAAQSKQHNNSMAQGVGCGHRADYSDGLSLPGGVGMLIDLAGDDIYSAGIFAQGSGYWFGVGLCIDAGGADRYTGNWYVQGAAAHFAAGVLLDEGGDDRYEARMATSLGTGHDLSLGFLADLGGNDEYIAGGLTMGSGNASGIGILVDVAGDDKYQFPATNTLGNANPGQGIRAGMISLGLFIDAGGNDTYNHDYARDNAIWGIGPDRSFKRLDVPRFGLGLDTTLTDEQIARLWAPVTFATGGD